MLPGVVGLPVHMQIGPMRVHFVSRTVEVANMKPEVRHWWWSEAAWVRHCAWLGEVFGTHPERNPLLDVLEDDEGKPQGFRVGNDMLVCHPDMEKPLRDAAAPRGATDSVRTLGNAFAHTGEVMAAAVQRMHAWRA